ncbi:hypothetical protein E4U53_003827 [Claviceps sorghi]|nr:hypothetical protein E4U53_003827 [Claviceps sorghi]
MRASISTWRLLLLGTSLAAVGTASSSDAQLPLDVPKFAPHQQPDAAVLAALEKHADTWMTEGDKLRLKRQGKKFADLTDHDEFIKAKEMSAMASQARGLVRPLLARVSTERLRRDLGKLTSFYSRCYGCEFGQRSALWLQDQIAEV